MSSSLITLSRWVNLLCFLLLVGCSDSRPATFPVSGTVSFADGQPVRFGTVQFLPDNPGPSARGLIDTNGRFELGTYSKDDGAVPGGHRVIITQHMSAPSGKVIKHSDAHGADDESSLVDIRYTQYEVSPLTANVEELDNQVKLRVERPQNPHRDKSRQPGQR
jgi:hypothetical protein